VTVIVNVVMPAGTVKLAALPVYANVVGDDLMARALRRPLPERPPERR
jgi:hypothetical protein